MNLQEATDIKEKVKKLYENEKDLYIKHKLKIILSALDQIISALRLGEAEKTISDRSLSGEQRVKDKIKELRSQLPEPQKCSLCPNPLFDAMKSSDEEPYAIDGKPVCRDCYFGELGDFIEKNPICVIRKR